MSSLDQAIERAAKKMAEEMKNQKEKEINIDEIWDPIYNKQTEEMARYLNVNKDVLIYVLKCITIGAIRYTEETKRENASNPEKVRLASSHLEHGGSNP